MKYDISWTSIFSLNNSPLCFHHLNFPGVFPGISVFLQVLHMTSRCFQAPKKYPTCNEFFHQQETSKMSVQGWKAPFMAIVICLDTLIFLKILSTFVDGVVGQMTIDICQMLLEHGSIKAKDSLLYVSRGGAPHRMPVATRHPKVLRFQGYIGHFPRFNRWDNYPTTLLEGFFRFHSRSSQLSPKKYQNS